MFLFFNLLAEINDLFPIPFKHGIGQACCCVESLFVPVGVEFSGMDFARFNPNPRELIPRVRSGVAVIFKQCLGPCGKHLFDGLMDAARVKQAGYDLSLILGAENLDETLVGSFDFHLKKG